jgi:hypothetical protein
MAGSTLVSMLLAGQLDIDEKQDEEERNKKALANVVIAPLAGVPLLRDMVRQGAETFASGREFDVQPIPALGALSSATGVVQGLMNDVGDGELDKKTVKDFVMTMGYVFGLPARQAWNTGDLIYDVSTGEITAEEIEQDPLILYRENLRDRR